MTTLEWAETKTIFNLLWSNSETLAKKIPKFLEATKGIKVRTPWTRQMVSREQKGSLQAGLHWWKPRSSGRTQSTSSSLKIRILVFWVVGDGEYVDGAVPDFPAIPNDNFSSQSRKLMKLQSMTREYGTPHGFADLPPPLLKKRCVFSEVEDKVSEIGLTKCFGLDLTCSQLQDKNS